MLDYHSVQHQQGHVPTNNRREIFSYLLNVFCIAYDKLIVGHDKMIMSITHNNKRMMQICRRENLKLNGDKYHSGV